MTDRPNNQLTDRPTNQTTNQLTDQPTNQQRKDRVDGKDGKNMIFRSGIRYEYNLGTMYVKKFLKSAKILNN